MLRNYLLSLQKSVRRGTSHQLDSPSVFLVQAVLTLPVWWTRIAWLVQWVQPPYFRRLEDGRNAEVSWWRRCCSFCFLKCEVVRNVFDRRRYSFINTRALSLSPCRLLSIYRYPLHESSLDECQFCRFRVVLCYPMRVCFAIVKVTIKFFKTWSYQNRNVMRTFN